MKKISTRSFGLALCFIWFLWPVSVAGIGVNYSFLLLPIFIALHEGGIRRPPDAILVVSALYIGIFVMAMMYQVDLSHLSVRRTISFAIFMSIFAYTFVQVDREMVLAFKVALIAISLIFALRSAIVFYTSGGTALGFEAKDVVGTNRFGFIYLLAFWLVYLDRPHTLAARLARYFILALLTAALLLTFSRSSVVALVVPAAIFGLASLLVGLKRPSLRSFLGVAGTLAGATLLVALLIRFVPLVFQFFDERLLTLVLNSEEAASHIVDERTSEGTRLLILRQIFEFVNRNPFTGSGYLGVWIMPDSPSGSAHNQYTDVLFRTGLLGFVGYLYLIYRVLRALVASEKALFWGLLSVLIYGLFNETFKEAQGAFVLAFLLGMVAQSSREKLAEYRTQTSSATGVLAPA